MISLPDILVSGSSFSGVDLTLTYILLDLTLTKFLQGVLHYDQKDNGVRSKDWQSISTITDSGSSVRRPVLHWNRNSNEAEVAADVR